MPGERKSRNIKQQHGRRRSKRRRPLTYSIKPGDMLLFDHSGQRAREKITLLLTDGIKVRKVK